ncbi:MAG: hypothetical protein U5R06_23515 [candidate division KSB1 bacterium]|nr:hypothetical protein [candidate division KSB1 bacterium]
MPNPISKVMPSASIVMGNVGNSPFSRHPDLALLVAESISSWSNVENFLLKLFVQILGGNKSLATDIYISLESQAAKTSAINAAARSILKMESDELKIFKAIMAISKANVKNRNKLAHWTWGYSPDLNEALLLVDPKATISEYDRSKIYVYKKIDFESIVESNNNLCHYIQLLKFVFMNHSANNNNELITELLSKPEIIAKIPK